MVIKVLEYPWKMAEKVVLPAFNSSLILSKIRTLESTPIPILRIIPAIPGRVRVA
jgi:hypothetical protein